MTRSCVCWTDLMCRQKALPIVDRKAFWRTMSILMRALQSTDLIERAMGSDKPLYVVAIGALRNITSAILIEPKIIEKIVVVWLGGNALHWPHNNEFNLAGDVLAARLVLDCGVPLVLIPCAGVTTHLRTTVSEIEQNVQGQGAIGDYLAETFKGYSDNHFASSKEIWDVVAIAYLSMPIGFHAISFPVRF